MWYISAGLKPLGPFELSDIQDRIRRGHISPFDLIYQEGAPEWKAAQEWAEVRNIGFPAFEAVGTERNDEPIWIVLRRDRAEPTYHQEGPFEARQIRASLESGKLFGDDLVWKKGLSGWSRLADRQEFTSLDL